MCHFYAMFHLLLFSGWAGKEEFTASQSPSPHPLACPAWILADTDTTGPGMETLSKRQVAACQSNEWPWSCLGRQGQQCWSSRWGCALWILLSPAPPCPWLPKPWEGFGCNGLHSHLPPLCMRQRIDSTQFGIAKHSPDLDCKSYRQTGANPRPNRSTMFEEKAVLITVIDFA